MAKGLVIIMVVYLYVVSVALIKISVGQQQLIPHTSSRGGGIVLTSQPADAALRASFNTTIRCQYAHFFDMPPEKFDLENYNTVVEKGRIYYLAKVRISDVEYTHLKITKPLPNRPADAFTLLLYQNGKTTNDPLVNFDRSLNATVKKTQNIIASSSSSKATTITTTTTTTSTTQSPKVTFEIGNGLAVKQLEEVAEMNATILREFIQRTGFNPPHFNFAAMACQTATPFVCIAKVQITDTEYAHIHLAKAASKPQQNGSNASALHLDGFQRGLSLTDPLEYFEPQFSLNQATSQPLDEWAISGMDVTIQKQFIQQSGTKPQRFDLVNYFKNEGANGTTYFLKVQISAQEFVHLCVWKTTGLSGKNRQQAILVAFLRGKSDNDTLEYFTVQDSDMYVRAATLSQEGWTDDLPAGTEIRTLVESIRTDFIHEAVNTTIPMVVPILYRKFTTTGYHAYVIKVQTNVDVYAHLVVFKLWASVNPGKASPVLVAFELNKTQSDNLTSMLMTETGPAADYLLIPANSRVQQPLSTPQLATDVTQTLIESVLPDFLRKSSGRTAALYTAFSERIQLTNPSIRFVKVQIGTDSFIHLKIVQLDNGVSRLLSFQIDKTLFDTIDYF